MQNFIQPGNTVTMTAPYAVTSGGGLKVGSLFGVANTSAASGAAVEADIVGVFRMSKVSAQAWAAGDKVYWDDAAKLMTTVTTGNLLIGVALEAAANPSSSGVVRLNGCAV